GTSQLSYLPPSINIPHIFSLSLYPILHNQDSHKRLSLSQNQSTSYKRTLFLNPSRSLYTHSSHTFPNSILVPHISKFKTLVFPLKTIIYI
ncbi:hypothetical protein Lal_00018615, partial [Lupinus albus]